ncbi:MAG TPA: hypothetical protein VK993_11250 [Chthoniobacterales bacterium]|nr:hypothetical protein [Chthoniobacterales bacterium]
MGYVYAPITLENARITDYPPVHVSALVDSASWNLCIPQNVREQLGLEEACEKPVVLANGQTVSVPYVGPVVVRFEDREAFVGALVTGDQVLLGAIPMQDMNVSIDPRDRKLIPNPPPWPGIVGGVRPA